MQERRRVWWWLLGAGCLVVLCAALVVPVGLFVTARAGGLSGVLPSSPAAEPIPAEPASPALPSAPEGGLQQALPDLRSLYEFANAGVVNVQVFVVEGPLGGEGAGSGFLIDDEGHIVTNNHVVADALRVKVIFSNGFETRAEVVGTDPDSDLAVLKVEEVPPEAHPLPLGDSDSVRPGDWVIAIGNPFTLGGTMTFGVVSAVGRTIPSGATPFSIPQAIQTDAAINPGNSGGPLLNLAGEVVGVNAQIRTAGERANSGVGFAIPSNIVRRVVPVLIEEGRFRWAYLGVIGGDVNLEIQEANDLPTQDGAYIDQVVPGGPAEEAGLRGSTGEVEVDGLPVPVGGDVVIAIDGRPVRDFADLLVAVTQHEPGDTVRLTVLRDGRELEVEVTLGERPDNS